MPLPGGLPPARAALLVDGDPHAFALTGCWAGAAAIAGSEPIEVAGPDADPFALLDRVPEVVGGEPCAVGGGWAGMLGYGLAARIEELPPQPPRPVPMPPFALAYYDHVAVADAGGRWWFEALWTPGRDEELRRRHALFAERLASALRPGRAAVGPFRVAPPGPAGHLAAVEACRERIAAGELFQANLCLRLEASFEGAPSALAVRVAQALSPEHGAFIQGPWGAVVSASPELFLRRSGRRASTQPIKGTAARVSDPVRDAQARAALAASEKDRAENVMIVDLMRNDLGRVARYGSVRVARTADPLPRSAVWHLVSEVEAELRDEVGDGELLRATFPPGSVTGAPKIQAMRVISELESTAREAYTGAIGLCSPVAGLQLNVAIRTYEIGGGGVWIGAGGGITAASDPHAELEECYVKAEPLVRAAGTALERSAPARPRAVVQHALSAGRERPDPAAGVFETVLVAAGTAEGLEAHIARLAHSAREVYGARLPDDLRERVASALRAAPASARLRIAALPAGAGALRADVALAPLDRRALEEPVVLCPYVLPGGLGAHKWLDRTLLAALARDCGGTPLIVDADGAVLECAWGNVWLVEGERLVTPDADGRILPGTVRDRILGRAGGAGLTVSAERIALDRMRHADGIIATSSLRLAVPAGLRGPASEAALRHADRLRERLRSWS